MEKESLEIISKLSETIGESGHKMVEYYATWYVYSSVIWCIVGITFLVYGIKARLPLDKMPDDDIKPFVTWLIRGGIIVISVIIIASNLEDLLAPEGIALHQLIKDIRG